MTILVEKYRPNKFQDVIGIDERIPNSCNEDMPHFLFVGKPGTGKTTVAKIIIKDLGVDYLTLNASDERGINTIREKVKSFAMTRSTNGKFKIVFLDEADFLTLEAQNSLRNLMEKYHKNCRFILTGNYENKFVDAIVSRCVKIVFQEPEKHVINVRLLSICSKENIHFSTGVIDKIIQKYYPDMRKMINMLQELSALNRTITEDDVKKEELIIDELFKFLKAKQFNDARGLLLNTNADYEVLISDIYSWLMKSQLTSNQKIGVLKLLADANKFIKLVINQELLFADFLARTILVLQ